MTISVWQEKAERATARFAAFRKELESAAVNTRYDLEAVAAGTLAGLIRGAVQASGKDYSIPAPNGMKLPPEVPAGLLLLGIAFSGQTEVSRDFHQAGAGVLAYSGGREAEQWMMRKGTKTPGAIQ